MKFTYVLREQFLVLWINSMILLSSSLSILLRMHLNFRWRKKYSSKTISIKSLSSFGDFSLSTNVLSEFTFVSNVKLNYCSAKR